MNVSPRSFGGLLTLSLATTLLVAPSLLLVAPSLGQTVSENPLRQARNATAVEPSSSNPVRPVSHAAPAAPRKPTGGEVASSPRASLQLASDQRSVLTPRQSPLTETNVMGGEMIGGGVIHEGEMSHPGDVMYPGDMIYEDDVVYQHGGKGAPVGGACCGGGGCLQCLPIPCPRICFDNFEVFAGVQGFTGPVNRGQTGSFGFHEGFNWGAPVPCFGALGAQVGLQTTQSNLSGAEFTDENRHQLFITGGLFRRVDWGMQGGIVFDYLSDDWYANTSLAQLRGEASWVFPCLHELGFWFAASTEEDTQLSTFSNGTTATETFESTNLYAFFYRHHFDALEGANARLFAGWTGNSDGLIGADLNLPLSCDWELRGGFAYLIPEQATGRVGRGHAEESWNIAVSLVWYPGARSAMGNDYYRPLFNVANNGSFMVGRR